MAPVHAVVEVDEAKFGKRKYNRGRWREGHWVLGGVERGTDNVFMEVVPTRDAATLPAPHNFKACTTWNRDSYGRMAFLRSVAASGIPAPYRESFRYLC